MDPSARYVTQAAVYDRLLIGRVLTDRRIRAYQKAGRYLDNAAHHNEKKSKRTILRVLRDYVDL